MNLAYVRILNQKEKRKAIYFFIETIDFIEMMLQSLWFLQCIIFILFLLGSKDLETYVFRTLMCIVDKPWSKQDV